MFNSNPCRRGWHSHLTISISCMLIKWVTLQLRLLQGYVGFLTTRFLSTAITSEAQKTQSSAGLSLAPLPIQQHRWNYLGLTLERGRAPTSAQSLFCSSRSPRCSPARCRVPVGGEYRSSWPAVCPPQPPWDLLPASPCRFGLLPLHVLSWVAGGARGAGWQPHVQAGTPMSLGKASWIFSPCAHRVGHSWVFTCPETAWSFTSYHGALQHQTQPRWEHPRESARTERAGQPASLPAVNHTVSITAGQRWLGNLKPVPPEKVTGRRIQAYLLQGEKGWDVKRQALPNGGIAKERKDRVHTDRSSRGTWSGHREEKVSLQIKPAHVTLIGNAYLGTRNRYHMAGAFYKIFHLLLHARLTLLHQQWHEQFSYLPVSFRLQGLVQCKRKHKSSLCQ